MDEYSSQQFFTTPDFWLAAALIASGKRLHGLEWSGSRAFFLFENRPHCEIAEQAHWSGDLQVPSKAFADAMRTLKDRLYGYGKSSVQKQKS